MNREFFRILMHRWECRAWSIGIYGMVDRLCSRPLPGGLRLLCPLGPLGGLLSLLSRPVRPGPFS